MGYAMRKKVEELIDEVKALIGEVSASPTANTLLERIQNLEGYVDGLEGDTAHLDIDLSALRDAITDAITPKDLKDLHDELVAIKGYVDQLEGYLDTVETKLDTLHTDVDGLEGLLGGGLPSAHRLPQEAASPYEPQVSINQENIGLISRIGDVEASPTANTVLERLKVLETELVAIKGYVDGLETTLASIKDTDGIKKITDTVTVEDTPPPTIYEGTKSIAAAATPEALAGSQALKRGVLVQAKYANTGYVQVGNSSDQHVRLYGGDVVFIPVDNLADVYVEVEVNGEDVDYIGS